MLLPVELRLEILRMEYLRWVERDDIITFTLNRLGRSESDIYGLKKASMKKKQQQQPQNIGNATLIQLF